MANSSTRLPRQNRVHILLLEDNPGYLRLTQEAFETVDVDAEIHTATTWSDARTVLSERADDETVAYPDLLLLDLELPRTDGFAVLAELRDASELPSLPILVLTSSVDETDIRRCYELHAAAYLEKPHTFDELASTARMISNFWIDQVRLPPA